MIKKLMLILLFMALCSPAFARQWGNIDVVGELTTSGHWELVAEEDITVACTNVVFSGLVDDSYKINAMITKGGGETGILYSVLVNGSTNGDGYQYLSGSDSAIAAGRGTTQNIPLSYINSQDLCSGEALIECRSGFPKTALSTKIESISGTTIGGLSFWGSTYETTDAVETLTVNASKNNGIGVGSNIQLWRLKDD